MELALIGLGKMGGNMAERLLRGGHRVVGADLNAEARARVEANGGVPAMNLKDAVSKLQSKPGSRHVWLMIPAGKPVDDAIAELMGVLSPGTRSSTAGTAITRTHSGAARTLRQRASTTSTAAPQGACGVSRTGTR